MKKLTKLARRLALSLTLAAGISLTGISSTLAQDDDDGPWNYRGVESSRLKSKSGFKLFGDRPVETDELESNEATLVWMEIPHRGAKGWSLGYRVAFQPGVDDSENVSLAFTENGREAASFDGELTYEEQFRIAGNVIGFYSFNRFHPYVYAGLYAVDVDAELKGTGNAPGCAATNLDSDSIGKTKGLIYGIGAVTNITEKFIMTMAYDVSDNVDTDYNLTDCRGRVFTLASYDSKVESYGVGLAYRF